MKQFTIQFTNQDNNKTLSTFIKAKDKESAIRKFFDRLPRCYRYNTSIIRIY